MGKKALIAMSGGVDSSVAAFLTKQAGYENRIYPRIIPELGHIPLAKLTSGDLQQFYIRLKQGGRLLHTEEYGPGLSDRMAKSCHVTCRVALDRAVAQGLILKTIGKTSISCGCSLHLKKRIPLWTPRRFEKNWL